jgi:hypothetical protein
MAKCCGGPETLVALQAVIKGTESSRVSRFDSNGEGARDRTAQMHQSIILGVATRVAQRTGRWRPFLLTTSPLDGDMPPSPDFDSDFIIAWQQPAPATGAREKKTPSHIKTRSHSGERRKVRDGFATTAAASGSARIPNSCAEMTTAQKPARESHGTNLTPSGPAVVRPKGNRYRSIRRFGRTPPSPQQQQQQQASPQAYRTLDTL